MFPGSLSRPMCVVQIMNRYSRVFAGTNAGVPITLFPVVQDLVLFLHPNGPGNVWICRSFELIWMASDLKVGGLMKKENLLRSSQVREEIRRYKWIESEHAGCDIGLERAVREWIDRYAEVWCKHHSRRTRSARKSVS